MMQIIVLVLIIYAYSLKRKLKFTQHGVAMGVAVVVHAFSIFLVMLPSFAIVVSPNFVLPEPRHFVFAAGVFHGLFGAVAFVLGVWLVAAWLLRRDVQGCFSRKKSMIVAFTFWMTAIIFGVILYAAFYGSSLLS
jgi:hypothetical protein